MNDSVSAKLQLVAGSALTATPLWVMFLQDVSLIGGAVASICGAIIGVHAVWRLWKRAQT